MEAINFFATNQLVGLSEQNLIDCTTTYGNQGCQGGQMDAAFQYVIKNQGVDTEASYPYQMSGPNACQFNPANIGAKITGFQDVDQGDESALQVAVAQQPVSVAIDASQPSFQFYKSGVYYEPQCSSLTLDHGVLVVGYGTQGSSDYWLVKNSWGTSWGMEGYILMSRNRDNNCGIASEASYPTIAGTTTTTTTATTTTTMTSGGSGITTGGNTTTGLRYDISKSYLLDVRCLFFRT